MEKEQKKQTRYPWHSAPEWADYAATDYSGASWWFEFNPVPLAIDWVRHGRYEPIEPCDDFKQSVESRPK